MLKDKGKAHSLHDVDPGAIETPVHEARELLHSLRELMHTCNRMHVVSVCSHFER
jgi:hypothetical protein